ncbi:MAG: ARMT1-like domain-containing protein [Planctomycetota bacterium]|nr:ARMT1-like domain-containing protein [Planctomycetota bacterium]
MSPATSLSDGANAELYAGIQGDRVFPRLRDPSQYVACRWDLRSEPAMRDYWLALFRKHWPTLLEEALREATGRGVAEGIIAPRLSVARAKFESYLDEVAAEPGRYGRLDILGICVIRERVLRHAGVADPYRLPKTRENTVALALLPRLLRELDAMGEAERAAKLIEGVFAGNIFDLGATSTAAMFKDGSVDFHAVRAKLAPRPWLIDDLDPWLARWRTRPHRSALLFVDNAGSDVLLGMLPLAREMLRRGTNVLLAANTAPSLNDITRDELEPLLDGIAKWDPTIAAARADGRLELVASGNGLPLIDLTRISGELVEATERRAVDLVVLEGMGRGVESNLEMPLSCDAVKIAMIKDRGVADALGGKLYDLVMRYEPV